MPYKPPNKSQMKLWRVFHYLKQQQLDARAKGNRELELHYFRGLIMISHLMR